MSKKKDTAQRKSRARSPQKNSEELAPKIELVRGQVEFKYVRCGRGNCQCAAGGKGHGPYLYIRRQSCGKRSRTYIKKQDADEIRAGSLLYKAQCEKARKESQRLKDLFAKIKAITKQQRIHLITIGRSLP
jgi:hypothetical protein